MTVTYPIYLDNNATTAVDERVLAAMLPTFQTHYGNPSSTTHSLGWYAQELVTIAREQVARAIGANAHEVYFTSGATESNNTVIRGLVEQRRVLGKPLGHIVSVVTEHHSVLETLSYVRTLGAEVTLLPVDGVGRVSLEAVKVALRDDTVLVTVMLANNEIGTVFDLAAISSIARERGALVHSDATQALGKLPIDVAALGVDFVSLSAHKAYGPKGIGALYVRDSISPRLLSPLLWGALQEGGLRSGTLNVSGIVGMGAACRLVAEELESDQSRLRLLSERFHRGIMTRMPDAILNGPPLTDRLPGNLNLSFRNIDAHTVIGACAGKLAVSLAAACTSSTGQASHVIQAIYAQSVDVPSAVRFGIGRFTTEEEIEMATDLLCQAVRK